MDQFQHWIALAETTAPDPRQLVRAADSRPAGYLFDTGQAPEQNGSSAEPDPIDPALLVPISIYEAHFNFDSISCELWNGTQLSGLIAFDTETDATLKDYEVPKLALAVASNSETNVFILPGQISDFIQQHSRSHFICHNAEFDFHVIDRNLGDSPTVETWRRIANAGQLHCTRRLAQLIDIAERDQLLYNPGYSLGVLVQRYLDISIDKSDPYRLRYGELIDHDWTQPVETGFLSYAIKDSFFTLQLWHQLRAIAVDLVEQHQIDKQLVRQYGYLTESLQVRAAIALQQIHINGVWIDKEQKDRAQQHYQQIQSEAIKTLCELTADQEIDIFKRSKLGELQYTDSGAPRMREEPQRQKFTSLANKYNIQTETTPGGNLSLSYKFWKQYKEVDPFIAAWSELEESSKLLQFFTKLNKRRIHPRYSALVRTGRTSCSEPNIQQIPRAGGFRQIIVAPEGKKLLTIDYSAIELVTLAHVQETRYGRSALADILRQGVDVHAYTAALARDMSYEDFQQLKTTVPITYKRQRQQAKVFGFGLPGGLGNRSIVSYAKQFGIEMSTENAADFRQMMYRIYPELEMYLDENAAAILAQNFKTTEEQVRNEFDRPWMIPVCRRIADGNFNNCDGKEYPEDWIDSFYESMATLNQNTTWTKAINSRDTTKLFKLFWQPVVSLSGRPRGPVPYSTQRNYMFQAAAADGAKLALWNLYLAGYHLTAFVHDEFVITVDDNDDEDLTATDVVRICTESMQPFCGTIPVSCEYSIDRRWKKP